MQFQGSGFSVELPEGAHDSSSYVFAFPALGEQPPTITVRFSNGDDVAMAEQMADVQRTLVESLPEAKLEASGEVLRRGEWEYFTHMVNFGDDSLRFTQKDVYILIQTPKPTLYVLTGLDHSDNFARFEPTYDNFVRTFQPNEIQRL